ncbi:MAG: DUF4271 domain-containing protein [Bacteroidota bacterium]
MEPILRETPTLFEPWMSIVFLVSLAALAYIRLVYPRRFGLLAKTAFRLQILRQVMREELLFSHRSSLVLFAHFIVMTSIIIYAAVTHYGVMSIDQSGIGIFSIILLAVLIVYLLKFSLMGFLKWAYADKGLIREYRFEVFSISKILGLVYLPIAILVVTQNVGSLNGIFIFALVLFLISAIWRTVQGLIMSFSYSVSSVYIILYLCTLEILPFVLFISLF